MNEFIVITIGFVFGLVSSLIATYFTFHLKSKADKEKQKHETIKMVLNPLSQRLDRFLMALNKLEELKLGEVNYILDFIGTEWKTIETLFYKDIEFLDQELQDSFAKLMDYALDIIMREYIELDTDSVLAYWKEWRGDAIKRASEFQQLIVARRNSFVKPS